MNFSISIWAERCTLSKEKFRDSEHDLVLFNCQNILEDITLNLLMIMKSDYKSLIVRKDHLEKYQLSTLENWMHSVKVSCKSKTLEEFEWSHIILT